MKLLYDLFKLLFLIVAFCYVSAIGSRLDNRSPTAPTLDSHDTPTATSTAPDAVP